VENQDPAEHSGEADGISPRLLHGWRSLRHETPRLDRVGVAHGRATPAVDHHLRSAG